MAAVESERGGGRGGEGRGRGGGLGCQKNAAIPGKMRELYFLLFGRTQRLI